MAWQAAIVGGAVLVLSLLARKASPQFRYALWCLVLIKLCCPPRLEFVTGVVGWVRVPTAQRMADRAGSVAQRPEDRTAAADTDKTASAPLCTATRLAADQGVGEASPTVAERPTQARPAMLRSWTGALAAAWLAGVAAMTALVAAQYRRLRGRLSRGTLVDDARVRGALRRACETMAIRRPVEVLMAADTASPVLFGLLRPRIVLPEGVASGMPDDQLEAIFLHELTHLRRGDLWFNWVQMILQTLYWFHPVVWYANLRLRREREMIVDDLVLVRLGAKREAYGMSLLSVLRHGAERHLPALGYVGIIEHTSEMVRRVQRVMDGNRRLSARLGWVSLAFLIALGLALIPQARSQERSAVAPVKSAQEQVSARPLSDEILRSLRPGSLLVVILHDESKSLLEERGLFVHELERTMDEVRQAASTEELRRLRWAVASFGEKAKMWLAPTTDMAAALETTKTVKIDPSGKENLIGGIQFVLGAYGAGQIPIAIVAVTDEEGDDTKKPEAVAAALAKMRAARARLFVFGPEACFQLPTVREWLRNREGQRVGPAACIERGLDSGEYEFFPSDLLWVGQEAYNGVPSGFGSWFLSVLAGETGGSYSILREGPPSYDEGLMSAYRPEWVAESVYRERTTASPLRRRMARLFQDYVAVRPASRFADTDGVKEQMREEGRKARDLSALVEKAIADLEPMQGVSGAEKHAAKRWQANYDLTMAMLLKLRFEAEEYVRVMDAVVKDGLPQAPDGQGVSEFWVGHDVGATRLTAEPAGMADARERFNRVIRDHKGTPWAEVAAKEAHRMGLLKIWPGRVVEPRRPDL